MQAPKRTIMFKHLLSKSILLASFFPLMVTGANCDVSGVWKHADKPATLFIDLNAGEVLVQSHQGHPQSTGLVVIKNLELSSDSTWSAQMYSAEVDSYVTVNIITSHNCRQMDVSYEDENILKLLR